MRLPIFVSSTSGTVRWSPRTVREMVPGFDEKYLKRRIEEFPELLGLRTAILTSRALRLDRARQRPRTKPGVE
jgi:hypothetical protein